MITTDTWWKSESFWDGYGGYGDSPANWRFDYWLQVGGAARAKVDVHLSSGSGESIAKAKVKVMAGCATMATVEDEAVQWVGTKVLEDEGGCTGFGLWSISWQNPDPQDLTPDIPWNEKAEIEGTKDNPGTHVFIKAFVETAAQAQIDDGFSALAKSSGANIDSNYSMVRIAWPQP
jgi:hypothetical protein